MSCAKRSSSDRGGSTGHSGDRRGGLPKDFRDRLSAIGKRGGAADDQSRSDLPERSVRARLGAEGARTGDAMESACAPLRLEELPGVTRTKGVFVVERTLTDFASSEARDRLISGMRLAGRGIDARGDLDELVRRLLRKPERALFLDTETTGLGGNMVFMIGMMHADGDDLRLTQVFARDYREERELLSVWAESLGDAELLVSFNGKSFDLPVLRDRMGLHGMGLPEEPGHLDLLHQARRRWSETLPDCRLQTLEWRICGRRRSGDIPGEEIPAVYHRYVRTGDPRDILSVFHHNALDLITLADIAVALTGPEDEPA